MAKKRAMVFGIVEPEIKEQDKAILTSFGLAVSVVIETIYRQIILKGGLPFSINNSIVLTLDNLSRKDFDKIMFKCYEEAINDESEDADSVFHELRKDLK